MIPTRLASRTGMHASATLLAAVAMSATLTGCGGDDKPTEPTDPRAALDLPAEVMERLPQAMASLEARGAEIATILEGGDPGWPTSTADLRDLLATIGYVLPKNLTTLDAYEADEQTYRFCLTDVASSQWVRYARDGAEATSLDPGTEPGSTCTLD